MNAHRSLGASADRLAVAMKRLSTGFRINSAADDAAGLGISEKMRGQIRGLEQANRNVQDGMSLIQTMEGTLEEVHSILHRARDLAVQYSSDTNSFADKQAIADELVQLRDEIARIESSTMYDGTPLFQGVSTITLQIGANDGETMAVSTWDLYGGIGTLVKANTFFVLPILPADIAGFDDTIDTISEVRAQLGATYNRLEHVYSSNTNKLENYITAESRIRDVDMAEEITAMTREQILQRSGTMALKFSQQTPARVLDLLAH
jgi:flagellin